MKGNVTMKSKMNQTFLLVVAGMVVLGLLMSCSGGNSNPTPPAIGTATPIPPTPTPTPYPTLSVGNVRYVRRISDRVVQEMIQAGWKTTDIDTASCVLLWQQMGNFTGWVGVTKPMNDCSIVAGGGVEIEVSVLKNQYRDYAQTFLDKGAYESSHEEIHVVDGDYDIVKATFIFP